MSHIHVSNSWRNNARSSLRDARNGSVYFVAWT